jgi:hypothetical protein
MQATPTLRRSRISLKIVVIIAAVLVAYVLGGASGYIAKSVSLQAAARPSRSAVLPADRPITVQPGINRLRRGGTPFIDEPVATPVPNAIFHEPGSRLGGSRI